MYKRVTAILLSISLLAGLLRINAQAIESVDIDDSEIELECNTDTEYDGASEPQEGLDISSSGTWVYGYTGSASKVIIPEGVEYIYKDAFKENSVIKEVSIPSSIKKIDESAFENCKLLKTVSLEPTSGDTVIEFSAFEGCSDLKSISIPEGYTKVGVRAFYECTSLESISLPSTLEQLERDAFYNAESVKTISFRCGSDQKTNLKTMAGEVFYNNISLEEIVIPEGIEEIGNDDFYGCSSLKSVSLPSTIKTIGSGAFAECSLSDGVTMAAVSENGVIDSGAFYGSKDLESIVIPEGYTKIGSNAFADSQKLKEISFPSTLTDIYSGACKGVISLKTVNFKPLKGTLNIYDEAFKESGIERLELPEGLQTIDRAFCDCVSLNYVKIPSTVYHILGSFTNDTALETVEFVDREDDDVKVNGGTVIETWAFKNCTSIKTIVFPKGCKAIRDMETFYGCSSLIGVSFPESMEYVDASIFANENMLAAAFYGTDTEIYGIGRGNSTHFTIYGNEGSTAEIYATENSLKFDSISNFVMPTEALEPEIKEIKFTLNGQDIEQPIRLDLGRMYDIECTVIDTEDNIVKNPEILWNCTSDIAVSINKVFNYSHPDLPLYELYTNTPGTIKITAKAGEKEQAAELMISSMDVKELKFTINDITAKKYDLVVGNDYVLSAGIIDKFGQYYNGSAVSWISSNDNVCTISENIAADGMRVNDDFLIIPKSAGTAYLTGSFGGKTKTVIVNVYSQTRFKAIEADESIEGVPVITIQKGKKSKLYFNLQEPSIDKFVWEVDNPYICKVNKNGEVTAKLEGKAIVTVTAYSSAGVGEKAYYEINVVPSLNQKIYPASIKVDYVGNKEMYVGEAGFININVTPNNYNCGSVKYKVIGKAVKVDKNGCVKAVKAGYATVYAYCGNVRSDSINIIVKQPQKVLKINKGYTKEKLVNGTKIVKLNIKTNPSYGKFIAGGGSVKWVTVGDGAMVISDYSKGTAIVSLTPSSFGKPVGVVAVVKDGVTGKEYMQMCDIEVQ